jgi:hypothetical protein
MADGNALTAQKLRRRFAAVEATPRTEEYGVVIELRLSLSRVSTGSYDGRHCHRAIALLAARVPGGHLLARIALRPPSAAAAEPASLTKDGPSRRKWLRHEDNDAACTGSLG